MSLSVYIACYEGLVSFSRFCNTDMGLYARCAPDSKNLHRRFAAAYEDPLSHAHGLRAAKVLLTAAANKGPLREQEKNNSSIAGRRRCDDDHNRGSPAAASVIARHPVIEKTYTSLHQAHR